MTAAIGEHFFRHEYGRLVALLSGRVGLRHLEAVEDAVQQALLAAVETWPRTAVPENPSAWLYQVAYNHFAGERRQRTRRDAIDKDRPHEPPEIAEPGVFLAGDIRDDFLRMLFICCDEAIPLESQLVLALKTLCGFDVREIADRLFTSEANVYKRLSRARSRLRELPLKDADLTIHQLASRLLAVQTVLHQLFTEGYLSTQGKTSIRRDLCDEACRLTELLAEHPVSSTPETFALLALMHLHLARMPARQDASGGLVLLEEQDRSLLDPRHLNEGLTWLARSATGDELSRFHAEAGIAAEHCLAPSFAETRWDRIVDCYVLLERVVPSALHTLNRAIALAEWRGPAEALELLEGIQPPTWLAGSYMWSAVLADLHRRCGHPSLADEYTRAALDTAPSATIRDLLRRRLDRPAR
jgi:RNA polymerase sigma-70 factor (ECF subfamily)